MIAFLTPEKLAATILICVSISASAQSTHKSTPFSVAFYNVENLFDTVNDPNINDNEFVPDAAKQWTRERYLKKQEDLARVIAAIPPGELPDLVGLCEVENRTVLLDLAKQKEIAAAGYGIVHRDSPDRRGIDVALFYKPNRFSLLHEDYFTIPLVTSGGPTREVLYAKGLVNGSDTLHVFVNHWPSRYGGVEKSAPNRNAMAAQVRYRIDSLQQTQPDCKILVMGDFNDNPDNESMAEILGGATRADQTELPLYNLHAAAWSRGEGTFNYRGEWSMLDQILVSWSLLNAATGLSVRPDAAGILREPWMIYTNPQGVEYPSKTYGGDSYYGGVSDHLPVFVEMEIIK
ncbi:MAG: endonuclease [Cryomorphaceae bacterium]|nr:MAG: endonuclease [Cryomorphaceae bacterium]